MNDHGKLSEIKINYKEKPIDLSIKFRGGNNNQLIMFIHGLGCSKESFECIWNSLDFKNYSLLTFDLVGYGNSSKPLNFSYDIAEQAEICNLLLNQFKYEAIHIVAHSMGGAVGLLLMEKIKDRLSSYISVEGNLIGADCGLVSRKTISYSFEEFQNKMYNMLIESNKTSEENSTKLWSEMLEKCSPTAFYKSSKSLVELSDSNKLLDSFINLELKKAYMYGDKNSQMDVLDMLKDIKKISISDSGHFLMIDNPHEFNKKLYNTIKEFSLKEE